MYSIDKIKRNISRPGFVVRYFSDKALNRIESLIPLGMNIYEYNWDVLIILDACRVDLFQEFAPQHLVYEDIGSVSSIKSIASTTQKWIPRTFGQAPDELVSNTHYVTATGYAEKIQNPDDLYDITHVWRYAKSPDYGLTRPEAVTDAGIEAIREEGSNRVIIHYSQPHAPFLHCVGKYESRAIGSEDTQNVWEGLRKGEFEHNKVWKDYGQNLVRVLDEIKTIVENASGKIVITSDHGNGMGEWGVYGHPGWAINSKVRNVPWAIATGKGKKTYTIKGQSEMETDVLEPSVEEHLRALGYQE